MDLCCDDAALGYTSRPVCGSGNSLDMSQKLEIASPERGPMLKPRLKLRQPGPATECNHKRESMAKPNP